MPRQVRMTSDEGVAVITWPTRATVTSFSSRSPTTSARGGARCWPTGRGAGPEEETPGVLRGPVYRDMSAARSSRWAGLTRAFPPSPPAGANDSGRSGAAIGAGVNLRSRRRGHRRGERTVRPAVPRRLHSTPAAGPVALSRSGAAVRARRPWCYAATRLTGARAGARSRLALRARRRGVRTALRLGGAGRSRAPSWYGEPRRRCGDGPVRGSGPRPRGGASGPAVVR